MLLEDNYRVNLELFEGPLDLLLHLIKRNDIDIHNIPIAVVLDQYVQYLELMKELNIDVAGDFILMASELTHIKSRMLLHQEGVEEEEPDPRADLMERLIEYQRYKQAAEWLTSRPLLNRDVFKRPPSQYPEELSEAQSLDIEPFVLIQVLNEVLKGAPKEVVHEIETDRVSITDRIYQIMELLGGVESETFTSLLQDRSSRADLIITLMAILEMARLKMIRIYQSDIDGPILVRRLMTMDEVDPGVKQQIDTVDEKAPE